MGTDRIRVINKALGVIRQPEGLAGGSSVQDQGGGKAVFVQLARNGGRARLLAGLGVALICGCGSGLGSSDDDRLRPTMASSISAAESPFFETDSNDFLESAEYVLLQGDPRLIHGGITGPQDVDVYDLGPAQPGDRIVAEMTPDASLDGVIAIFDDAGASLLVNDHRNTYLGRSDPFVDVVIRRPSTACYVAVAATPGYEASGDYRLVAYKQSPVAIPPPRPEVVLLVFDGGNHVRVGSRPAVDVPYFDAVDIDPVYAGRTAEIIAGVVAGVREDYAGLDVTILSTSEGVVFDGSMTRIFFGAFDQALLGVAENVDEFNATEAQEAIVFTDTFAAFMPLNPEPSEMAQALANVASHELGHLLGLVHTVDPRGIMDVTASLRDLLTNQSFRKAPLHADVFPIGSQDGIQMLLDTVGGDQLLSLMKYVEGSAQKRDADLVPTGPPARAQFIFTSTQLDEP